MKKAIPAVFLILIVHSIAASAAISIDSINKKQLNIGDKLTVSYNLTSSSETEVLFKLTLRCSSFDLSYYTIPVGLKVSTNKSIVAPPLTVNSQMQGNCFVKAQVQSTDNTLTEEMESDTFGITNEIGVKLETNGKSFLPGEKLEINGALEQSFSPLRAVMISLDKQAISLWTSSDTFNKTIDLSKTMKSGEHTITAAVNDSHGNKGTAEATITIAQVPTSILANTEKDRFDPGETIKTHTVLLDQANDSMNGTINVRIVSGQKKDIFASDVESGGTLEHETEPSLPPGIYTIKAASMGVKAEKKIVINTVEKAAALFDRKRTITVKNTGNVDYGKYTDIRLSTDDGKELSLVKKLKLKPGEETSFDLYTEFPANTYTISFSSEGQRQEFPGIATQDQRSFPKKAFDGIKGVTGMVVGTSASEGFLFKRPFLALLTVMAIVVLIFIIYKGERQRRKELAQKTIEALREDNIIPIKGGDDTTDETLNRDQHKKFVEDMLKEKQFK